MAFTFHFHIVPDCQPPSVVVVQFDQGLDVTALPVSAVHELPGFLEAEAHIVAAAPPLPPVRGNGGRGESDGRSAAATRFWYSLFTRAFQEGASGACPCDGVGHSGRSDGVNEPCLPGISHEYLPHAAPLCGAVPPSAPELVCALRGSERDASGDLLEQPGLVAADLREPAAQAPVLLADHAGVEDHCTARRPPGVGDGREDQQAGGDDNRPHLS